MENLSDHNFFISRFVMGTRLPKNKKIDCLTTLQNWLDFKNDIGLSKALYVSFLYEIDPSILDEILKDYVRIYKKSFPYGTRDDFRIHLFSYTIYDLEKFISRDYISINTPSRIENYRFYKFYEFESRGFLEFAIESEKTIEHFKQYYKKVLQLINDVQFEDVINPISENQIHEPIENNTTQIGEKECLNNMITHTKSHHIVENIKVRFKGIKGKRLKLLLLALQDSELLPKDRVAAKFHRCCENEFGWNIASYNAMNVYKFNDHEDVADLEEMKTFLESLK